MVTNISIWLTLEPLLYSEESLHLRDLARRLKKSHTTIRKHLSTFEREGIVTKSKKGRLTLYSLNYNNPLIVQYITLIEKEKIIRICKSDLIMKELISTMSKLTSKFVIFGSSVKGTKKANDIDILLVGSSSDKEKIKKFEDKMNIKTHIVDIKSFTDLNLALKREISKSHLIINCSEEVIGWMLEK